MGRPPRADRELRAPATRHSLPRTLKVQPGWTPNIQPCGSEKWTCRSGCGPKMAWGLPMFRVMHWGERPLHFQEAQEQPCSEGQADDR